MYAFPLFSAYSRSEEEKELWFLFPLTHARWDGGLKESHVFPFYYWRRRDNLLVTLPFSYRDDGEGGFASVFGPLALKTWGQEKKGMFFLWPLTGFVRSNDEKKLEHWVFPLWEYHTSEAATGAKFLWPLGAVEAAGKRFSHRFFPLWYYKREDDESFLNLCLLLLNYWSSPGESEFYTALPPAGALWDEESLQHGVWPLYFYGAGGGSRQLHAGPFLPLGGEPGRRTVIAPTGYKSYENGHSA